MPRLDLIGKRFGRLTVIAFAGTVKQQSLWLCRCDCGREKVVRGRCLQNGNTRSCGCLRSEVAAARARNRDHSTHGLSHTRIYRIWRGMMQRCYKEHAKDYPRYGGRGITVCEEWHDVLEFYDWAVLNGYQGDSQIDRIDNNGNYEPNNCRWVAAKKQQNNRRSCTYITIDGCIHTATQWCEIKGLSRNTYLSRVASGKTPYEAITAPVQRGLGSKVTDLTGNRYGGWTVLGLDEIKVSPDKRHNAYWRCQCDCGIIESFSTSNIKQKKTPCRHPLVDKHTISI